MVELKQNISKIEIEQLRHLKPDFFNDIKDQILNDSSLIYFLCVQNEIIGVIKREDKKHENHFFVSLNSKYNNYLREVVNSIKVKFPMPSFFYFKTEIQTRKMFYEQNTHIDAHLSLSIKNDKKQFNHSVNHRINIDSDFNYDKWLNFFTKVFQNENYVEVENWLNHFQRINLPKNISYIKGIENQCISALLTFSIDEKTEYVFLSGTLLEFRGLGLYAELFNNMKIRLDENVVIKLGVWQNTKAYRIYKKQGFEVFQYNCFVI